MRILIILDVVDNGGVGIVLRNLLNNIHLEKYKIDILAVEENPRYEELLPKDVNIRHLYKKNPAKHSNKYFRYIYAFAKEKCPKWFIRRKFIKNDYDLAIDFKGNNLNLLTAMKCPKIFWSHKDFSPETNPIEKEVIEKYSKTKPGAAKEKMFIRNLSRVDKVVCISNACKAAFSNRWSYPEERIQVLLNVLDVASIKQKSEERIDFVKPQVFTFCCMSRISSGKGIERLLECVDRLNKEGYKFFLNIIGGGDTLEEMKSLTRQMLLENVYFQGNKDNPYPYLLQSDVFVYPSETEAYSTAVCEALILGMPIITTKTASVPEIFSDGEYGVVVDNDTTGIYKAMKAFMDDNNLICHYRNKAKQRLSYFNAESRARAVEEFLDEFQTNKRTLQ